MGCGAGPRSRRRPRPRPPRGGSRPPRPARRLVSSARSAGRSMTRRSAAPGGSTAPAANSSRALVTAANWKRAGISGCGPALTHTALAPVTWPRCTRHSSPELDVPGWQAAAGPGGAGPGPGVPARPGGPDRRDPAGRLADRLATGRRPAGWPADAGSRRLAKQRAPACRVPQRPGPALACRQPANRARPGWPPGPTAAARTTCPAATSWPGRKQVMAEVAVASANTGTAGSTRCTDSPPSTPSSRSRTRRP